MITRSSMKIKDFVNLTHNKRNSQESLNLKKKEFKKHNLSVKDILDIEVNINNKIKRFDEI